MVRKVVLSSSLLVLCAVLGVGAHRLQQQRVGRQADGSFLVATGQRIEPGAIAFDGRPIDLALHPSGKFFAVLDQSSVFLADSRGIIAGSGAGLPNSGCSYRGAAWAPDGRHLYVSAAQGWIQEYGLTDGRLFGAARIAVSPGAQRNPRPGGMAVTRDGSRLFVVAADRNAVAEIDLAARRFVREYPVQNIPFAVRLSEDESSLIVTNWGGRKPAQGEQEADSGGAEILVDSRGVGTSGTVSIICRATGETKHVAVGLHPTDIAVAGELAYVANAASDTISVIDIPSARAIRSIPIRWRGAARLGCMPDALAVHGQTLYACDGGDNAVCEISLTDGEVRGFRPAGFFPVAIAVSKDGGEAYVVNTKGNGSVRRTTKGAAGNAHDFQGTVSVVDLRTDLAAATERVVADDHWRRSRAELRPNLAVYKGSIKHVLYIIKENRSYDQVFGDMPGGNGDPSLCALGEKVTPNQHELAREFTLFDNAYVAGTNSAEGHAWCNQAIANDYLEHFYGGYRTYPYGGDCAMSIAATGNIWDNAAKRGKSIRVYGEFCAESKAKFQPSPRSWLDIWNDHVNKTHTIKVEAHTTVAGLRKYIHPSVLLWPLLQCDQQRADLFIDDYLARSRQDAVPNLMILCLPCDHTAGLDPKYPKPASMVADNDLALGRIVDTVSHSAQWKDTCIFVIEDDAQAGLDHVDGHRTVCLVLSPYIRRRRVDSSMVNTISVVRSIELMLGLNPMNRFDALATPFSTCFTDTPDLTPYSVRPNQVRLDDMNHQASALTGKERYWAMRSSRLDWSGLDRADPDVLNRIIWHSERGFQTPYPTVQ